MTDIDHRDAGFVTQLDVARQATQVATTVVHQGPATYVASGPTGSTGVALTFHTAGDASIVESILDQAGSLGAKATFFVVGTWATANPAVVTRILDGEMDLIVNTPFGSPGQAGPRLDGYEIRTAAVRRGVPCVTTVQGLAAAVQGIEAITRGEVGVRSLQEHAALLRGGQE